MLKQKDVDKVQKKIQKIVEVDLQGLIATFPEKSNDKDFLLLNEASRNLQNGITRLGEVIARNNI